MIPISEPRPTLAQLRSFLAVAEQLHFREAAAALGVSQPTLSGNIASLEELLDRRLLERTTRKVLLTPAGERVAEHARRVLVAVEDLMGEVASGPFGGSVALGVIPTVAPYVLPVLLPMFARGFPELKVAVREARAEVLVEDVRAGRLDLGLLALPAKTGLVETPLYEEELLLALPRDHPLAAGSVPLPREALKGLDVVLLDRGHCLRDQVAGVCREAGAEPVAMTYASSLETLVQLVAGGLGVTLLPEPAEASERGRLALRRFDAPAPGRTIGLVCRAGQPAEFGRLAGEIRDAIRRARLPVTMTP
ncbi:LysR substrate-binding domain-containing protein [Nonomuraea rosea]|uniref:Probable hydrogen peroxide-inducible genes activator n=1 Tax=Nonomuraea rosea TaxID=638574 RepID=A0ABP6VT16_9ACTN